MSAAPRPLVALRDRLQALPRPAPVLSGQVVRYDGLHLDTTGFPAQPGALACVQGAQGRPVLAEVVGFEDGRNKLVVTDPGTPILAGAGVHLLPGGQDVAVGEGLLGRVTDAQGTPLDNRPAPVLSESWPLAGKALGGQAAEPAVAQTGRSAL